MSNWKKVSRRSYINNNDVTGEPVLKIKKKSFSKIKFTSATFKKFILINLKSVFKIELIDCTLTIKIVASLKTMTFNKL